MDWNWPISREKYLKIDWPVKIAVTLAYCGSCRLLPSDGLLVKMNSINWSASDIWGVFIAQFVER